MRIEESQEQTFKKCGLVRCLSVVEGVSLKGLVGSPHSLLLPGDEGTVLFWYDVGLATVWLKGMEPDDHRLQTSKQPAQFLSVS